MAAIYQWFSSGRFIDYDYVLVSTDWGWNVRYIGYDYNTEIYTDFAQIWVEKNVSVVTDGKNIFCDNDDYLGNPVQYLYRGHCFSKVLTGVHGGSNASKQMAKVGGLTNKLIFSGVHGFARGLTIVPYAPEAPYSFGTAVKIQELTGTRWLGIFDLNVGNNGLRGYGDHFVVVAGQGAPGDPDGSLATYTHNGSTVSLQYELLLPDGGPGYNLQDWGWDPQTGDLVGKHWFSNDNRAWFYTITLNTGLITYEGMALTVGTIYAIGFHNGYVISAEYDLGVSTFRTYTRSGTTLTLVDSYVMPGGQGFSEDSHFEISRMSGRLWYICPNGSIYGLAGILIMNVDVDGTINILFRMGDHGGGSSGYMGSPFQFLDVPLSITPNGFAGTKGKLFECWEMNEVGSVNRVGAMNGTVFTPVGTVTNRAGTIGNAADFNGSSALVCTDTAVPLEMRAVDDFTICLDVTLDNKTTTQYVIGRGWISYSLPDNANYDFALYYDQAVDRFVWEIRSTTIVSHVTTIYQAVANSLGSPTVSQKYHICLEYNKTADTMNIRINDSFSNSTTLPLGTLINAHPNADMAICIGRKTTTIGQTYYFDGSVDGVFWFWDILTAAEKTWMYNSGNSRAFSEL